jgi:hypothetical protein
MNTFSYFQYWMSHWVASGSQAAAGEQERYLVPRVSPILRGARHHGSARRAPSPFRRSMTWAARFPLSRTAAELADVTGSLT